MADSRLDAFADRLIATTTDNKPSSIELLYWKALESVSDKFNKIANLPFEDRHQKAFSGFMQLHVPCVSFEDMVSLGWNETPEEWRHLYPAEEGLGKWLLEHSEEIATQFINGVRFHNIDTLFKLELPQGVRGAFWRAPFRLVWDYNINDDNYIARFDIIGSVSTNPG